ncbi:MAG: ribosome small subunit-dependent GTPase A [Phycisphaerae bacterium]|nr:ribosome small subunit-dependent GTPase A [Phycisphaerae bacterium]
MYPELNAARIISQHRDLYKIASEKGECLAEVSGKFRYEVRDVSDFPVVGDFVMIGDNTGDNSHAIIHEVLIRKSSFERTAAGKANQSQVIASNIDIIFICMSLNNDYNLSRLERYLSAAWDSRATPVVVLTKSDLCDKPDDVLTEVSAVAIGAEIIMTSSHDQASYNQLLNFLKDGHTASFIGSSGVGKSTLINCLAGQQLLATSEIRQDDKGRHTSTRRELLVLPDGGIVIDTPGMREFGVESIDLSRTFADIDELINQCRFNDCSHASEPGCAVRKAIADDQLDERRFENYQKLQKEARYVGLNAKQIEKEKLNDMFSEVGGMKKVKKFIRSQKNRKL